MTTRQLWRLSAVGSTLASTALLACTLLTPCADALTSISEWNEGFATFYGGQPDGMSPDNPSYGTSDGSCGFGVLNKGQWPYWSVAALATSNPFFLDGPVQGCGQCFEVECLESGPLGDKPGSCQQDPSKRSLVVQITDQCPECGPNHMDLQALTWAKIAQPSPSGGRVNIQYRRVQCAPPSNIIVTVNDYLGDSKWIRLQVVRVGGHGGISGVQLRGQGGSYESMTTSWGATWELPVSPPAPLDILIFDDAGNQVEAQQVIGPYQTGQCPTAVQFEILDPTDVQPSGNTIGTNKSASSLRKSALGSSGVQAFSGASDSGTSTSPGSFSPSSSSASPSAFHPSASSTPSSSPTSSSPASPFSASTYSASPSGSTASNSSASPTWSPSPSTSPSPSSTSASPSSASPYSISPNKTPFARSASSSKSVSYSSSPASPYSTSPNSASPYASSAYSSSASPTDGPTSRGSPAWSQSTSSSSSPDVFQASSESRSSSPASSTSALPGVPW